MITRSILEMSLLFALAPSHVYAADTIWPTIRSEEKKISVTDADKPDQAGLEMTIERSDGQPLYRLLCHSGDYDSIRLNYSGLVQCYLHDLLPNDQFKNLLDGSGWQRRSWESRGRFLAFHLEPPCAAYPDWGAMRQFKLRGMDLKLKFEAVRFISDAEKTAAPYVKSYSFSASVIPDRNASSATAQPPTSPEPPWFYSTRCSARDKSS